MRRGQGLSQTPPRPLLTNVLVLFLTGVDIEGILPLASIMGEVRMVFGFGQIPMRKRSDGTMEIFGVRVPALTLDEYVNLVSAPKLPKTGIKSAAPNTVAPRPGVPTPRAGPSRAPAARQPPAQSSPRRGPVRSVIEAAWTAPTDAIGLTYGYLGHGLGEVLGTNPQVIRRPGRTEFVNNPFAGVSAITLGRATAYKGNPYDPTDSYGQRSLQDNKYPVWQHEDAHFEQARILGPLYLPANLFGGLNALAQGQDWHGDGNYMERGPQLNPPRPWTGEGNR